MIVRAIDTNGDWTFGAGRNNYKRDLDALEQIISTRLNSFLGDCFFATADGVAWFQLLGGKSELAIGLAVTACLFNTPNVLSVQEISVNIDQNRNFTVEYTVNTIYGQISSTTGSTVLNLLLTQGGSPLLTQGGEFISP